MERHTCPEASTLHLPSLDEVAAAAESLIGVPFRHQGRVAGGFVDCVGLALGVASLLSWPYIDATGYGPSGDEKQLRQKMEETFTEFPVADAKPGMLLVLRPGFGKPATHVSVLTEKGMVHAVWSNGCVVEERYTDAWKRLTESCWGVC